MSRRGRGRSSPLYTTPAVTFRPPTPRKGVTGGHRPKTVWTALARPACWPSTDWAASAVASSSGRPLVQPPISFL